jgi:hypothetical protein
MLRAAGPLSWRPRSSRVRDRRPAAGPLASTCIRTAEIPNRLAMSTAITSSVCTSTRTTQLTHVRELGHNDVRARERPGPTGRPIEQPLLALQTVATNPPGAANPTPCRSRGSAEQRVTLLGRRLLLSPTTNARKNARKGLSPHAAFRFSSMQPQSGRFAARFSLAHLAARCLAGLLIPRQQVRIRPGFEQPC